MWLSHGGSSKGFFVTFRFHGPLDPYSGKVWKPDDFWPID
ncbi:hypothetical protein MNBD_ACTINO01-2364 [hydrothermal vent metagenome]|uniref:Uncharacterized protein n=1 Tax=hydrothermal vent metagenome TaxID=652676 RepID=A0A3B0SQB8_9ZZZZ